MNDTLESINALLSNLVPKELIDKRQEDPEEKKILNLIESNYDDSELKAMIEEKVDEFMMKDYNELFNQYDQKIYDLLEIQEKLFIKNQMIKNQIHSLDNYVKVLFKNNNASYINQEGSKN